MADADANSRLPVQQVLDSLEEVFFVFSAEGEMLQWNRRVREVTGYTDEEISRMDPAEFAPADDRRRIARKLITVLRQGRARLATHLITKDGRRIPYEFTGSLLEHDENQLICGTGRDISDQREAEKKLRAANEALSWQIDRIERQDALVRLMGEVAGTANKAEHFEEALQKAVDNVCAHTGWPVGHVYIPSADRSNILVPTAIWNRGSRDRFEVFRRLTEETSFTIGEGLPGRVFRSGDPIWIGNVTEDPNFPRSRLAENIGVKGAFGFPVPVDDEVVAVLEFFSESAEAPDDELLEVMRSIGVQLGRVAERQRARESLEASEKKYRALTETAVDAIVVADRQGNITDWNEGARAIFGYREEEVLGESLEMLMPERYRERHRQGMNRVDRTGEGRILGHTVELEAIRRSGEEFPIELSLSSWTVGGKRFFASIIRDITERKEIERELRESEEKFRTLAEQSLVGIALKQNGVYEYVNPTFAGIFGYESDELTGESPEMVVHPEDWPEVKEKMRRRISGEEDFAHYTVRGKSRADKTVYLEVYGARIEYRGAPAIITAALDVTEKRQMEREILRIQEEERRRIGQELHDGVASQLTGITMLSEALVSNLKEGQEVTPEQLEEITQLIRDANRQTRRLSRGLNPVEVGGEGLPAALEKLAASCKEQSGLSCTARTEGALPELDQQTATHLYRIAQEAMNNAIKHAGASRIWIHLATQNGHVELSVGDDGKGMPQTPEASEGIGLHTMRYRADLIGGRLEIGDSPEGGTRVRCYLPRE